MGLFQKKYVQSACVGALLPLYFDADVYYLLQHRKTHAIFHLKRNGIK